MKFSWKFRIANAIYGNVLRNWLAIDYAALDGIIRRVERRNGIISAAEIEELKSIMADIRGLMTGKRGDGA